MMVKLKDFS